jgi:hypothetical protein
MAVWRCALEQLVPEHGPASGEPVDATDHDQKPEEGGDGSRTTDHRCL